MRENIEWLIEQYTDEIEKLKQSRREDSGNGISISNVYITAKIGVYGKVVGDLQSILDESEDEG